MQVDAIMADAFYRMKDFRTGISLIGKWLLKFPALSEGGNQSAAYDLFDERYFFDWAFQWIRFKRDSKDEELEVRHPSNLLVQVQVCTRKECRLS
jgi:hypothetical protein